MFLKKITTLLPALFVLVLAGSAFAAFTRTMPHSSADRLTYLTTIHVNRSHVKSVVVNQSSSHIEVDLDEQSGTSTLGDHDQYIPIRKGKAADAKVVMDRIWAQSAKGVAPTAADAQALYDMIDQTAN